MFSIVSRLVAVVVLLAAPAAAQAADVSFAGKTIQFVVNFAAGGPSDIFARHYQRHLQRHLPGNPTVIVENRPGASGLLGSNYVYNIARPDGLTIGSLTAIAVHPILGKPNVKYDITKFHWLGAVPQSQILMVRKDLGVLTPADLLKPGKPLVYGNTGVNAAYITTRLFLELMGAEFQAVSGYRGQSQTIQAMRRGEINITDLGISGYLPHQETYRSEGLLIALLQRGVPDESGKFTRLAALRDLPTMEEALAKVRPEALKSAKFEAVKALVGTFHVQFAFVLPPATPRAVVDTLAKGYVDMFRDPAVAKETMARFKMEHEFVDGPSSQRYVAKLFADFNANPNVQKIVRAVAGSGGPAKAKPKPR